MNFKNQKISLEPLGSMLPFARATVLWFLRSLAVFPFVAGLSHAQESTAPAEGPVGSTEIEAPEAPEGERREPPQVRLPELSTFVEAAYPRAALAEKVEGQVVLELSISDSGRVAEVRVVEGLGHGLDEAAKDAALGFVFVPAARDGVNVAAKIRYAYEFRLPVPGSAEPEPAASTQVEQASAVLAAPATPATPAGSDPGSTGSGTVVVRGHREGDRKIRSAEAITVVALDHAKRESADLGEVLARAEGVNVQRTGGLGSEARFSLAGFDDTQVRFFIDGIPLEYQGFSMGLQNVPLNFAESIDIYKGVVPVQFGADSLGGAFNLVTDRRTRGTQSLASYQAGSWDTHRVTGGARHLDEGTGLFVKAEGFYDKATNDYPIDVTTGTNTGGTVDVTVRRHNDDYEAGGVNLEVGFVNRPWASRLLLKGFYNTYQKGLPHNPIMTKPYGEVEYGGVSSGVNLRYEHYFGKGLSGSFVSGYVYDRTNFDDQVDCVYDWYGQCVIDVPTRGEIRAAYPSDQSIFDHTGYLRWHLDWELAPGHSLTMSTAPTYFERKGEDHLREASPFSTLKAQRSLLKWVNGVEYEAQLFDSRFENDFFVKNYMIVGQSDEVIKESAIANADVTDFFWGVGDGARYAFNDWALAKASYEYAIRIPDPHEYYGNTVNIIENLQLHPERSHNVNLSLLMNRLETDAGTWDAHVTGFSRWARDLILLIARVDLARYENAYLAHIKGVEGAVSWLAPGQFLELGVNATYQDMRNASDKGTVSVAVFKGDRLPNKPYLFGNAMARLVKKRAMIPGDEASLTWYTRYTHHFLRIWESLGSNYEQPVVPSQLVHTAVLAYLVRGVDQREVSFSVEGQNLTDEKVFDFYRVQRAGRSFFFKVALVY